MKRKYTSLGDEDDLENMSLSNDLLKNGGDGNNNNTSNTFANSWK